MVELYVKLIREELKTLDDVPVRYREAVEALLEGNV